MIKTKRIYLPAESADGFRIFVDRLWARGISKENSNINVWAKDIAPSDELRKWFAHKPERFAEFSQKYTAELNNSKYSPDFVRMCREKLMECNVTLLYSAKDTNYNNAVVLKQWLDSQITAGDKNE